MSPAAHNVVLRGHPAPGTAAVADEPLSPFVTTQQLLNDTYSPSELHVASSKDIQCFDQAAYRGGMSNQAGSFQPLDSPVEFAASAMHRPPVPRRSSASSEGRRASAAGEQFHAGPTQLQLMPLSSGWVDSGSYDSIGNELSCELELELGRQHGVQLQQQLQKDHGPFAQQWGQQQLLQNGYGTYAWPKQQQQQQPPASLKQQGKLQKLLSWGSHTLHLPQVSRRQSGTGSKAASPPGSPLKHQQQHHASGIFARLSDTLQQRGLQQQRGLHPVAVPDGQLSVSPTSSLVSRKSSLGWCNMRLSEELQHVPAAAGLETVVSGSCPSSPQLRTYNYYSSPETSVTAAKPPQLAPGVAPSTQLVSTLSASSEPGTRIRQPGQPLAGQQQQQQNLQQQQQRAEPLAVPRRSLGGCRARHSGHHRGICHTRSGLRKGGLGRGSLGTSPLEPSSSLRTALMHLEHAASTHANRLKDKINSGIARLTSFTSSEGMLQLPVGREVLRDWEFGPEIGHGASCVTRLVLSRATGAAAACKTIVKSGIFRSAAVKAAMLGVQRELAIMQYTRGHPHVVQLLGVYEDARALHLVMDWCAGGCLEQLATKRPGGAVGETAAAAVAKATLEVLAHIHEKGVMHRDIKPENILLSRCIDDPQQLSVDCVKVADFGISVPITTGKPLTEVAGTLEYMAPELLQRCYGTAADVWSTGVMLYELMSGKLPFKGDTTEQLLRSIQTTEVILSGPAWQAVSDEAKQLVGLMLQKDPAVRPTARQLLNTFTTWLELGCM